MANTGKARKTEIIKTETVDGVAKPAVTYSMLVGPPAGTVTPPGFTPLAALDVRRMTSSNYLSAFRSFMGMCGVPQLQQDQYIAQVEYTDHAACPIWGNTGHTASGRYTTRLDAYNLGTTSQYTLFSPSGEFTMGESIGIDGGGSALSDGWYRAFKTSVPDAEITFEVLNGLVNQILLGNPNDPEGPGGMEPAP